MISGDTEPGALPRAVMLRPFGAMASPSATRGPTPSRRHLRRSPPANLHEVSGHSCDPSTNAVVPRNRRPVAHTLDPTRSSLRALRRLRGQVLLLSLPAWPACVRWRPFAGGDKPLPYVGRRIAPSTSRFAGTGSGTGKRLPSVRLCVLGVSVVSSSTPESRGRGGRAA